MDPQQYDFFGKPHICIIYQRCRLPRTQNVGERWVNEWNGWNGAQEKVYYQEEHRNKSRPVTGPVWPRGRSFRLPDFHDIRHIKVVRSSASRTGRLYLQECSWYSFSLGTEEHRSTRSKSFPTATMSTKNPTQTDLGMITWLSSEMPATKGQIHGADPWTAAIQSADCSH